MIIKHENMFVKPITVEDAEIALAEWERETKRCLDDFGQIENPTKEQFAMLDFLQEEATHTRMALIKYIKAIRQ